MNKNRIGIVVLTILICFLPVFNGKAQQLNTVDESNIISSVTEREWYRFRTDISTDPKAIFEKYGRQFGLGENDRMKLVDSNKDRIGLTHYRYQQYHRGIKVEGAEFIVHARDGRAFKGNGKIASDINIGSTVSSVSEEKALEKALAAVGAREYLWQDKEAERALKERKGDSNATYFPKGELVFLKNNIQEGFSTGDVLELAWGFQIYDRNLDNSQEVFVNAQSGNIIKTIPLTYKCVSGYGASPWYGALSFKAKKINDKQFILDDECGYGRVHTRNWGNKASNDKTGISEYIDSNNIWLNDSSAVAAHSIISMHASGMYSLYFQRQSFDGKGGDIDVYNNVDMNNATWSKVDGAAAIKFGNGSSNSALDDYATFDIAGHEFTHGVVGTSAGLKYSGESGALNESFADIFGTAVERWSESNNTFFDDSPDPDWLIGEDRGGIIRNMANPKQRWQPDTYKGANWADTNSETDNGGVHTNSGVQNFWFYLLCEGGKGINDNGENYDVKGIGFSNALQISYQSLTNYLTAYSYYPQARRASLEATEDYFGSCSDEMLQVMNAWQAVGLKGESEYCTINDQYYDNFNVHVFNNIISTCIFEPYPFVYGVHVEEGQTLTLSALEKIAINNGFLAEAGSHFIARIGCGEGIGNAAVWNESENIPILQAKKNAILPAEVTSPPVESQSESFSLYPNPFSDTFTVELGAKSPEDILLTLSDVSGNVRKTVAKRLAAGRQRFEVDASDLPAGVYFWRLQTGAKQYEGKIVKQ